MRRLVWDRAGRPGQWAAEQLGLRPEDLGTALHTIKGKNGLNPRDRVKIYNDGAVTAEKRDEDGSRVEVEIGNVFDENY